MQKYLSRDREHSSEAKVKWGLPIILPQIPPIPIHRQWAAGRGTGPRAQDQEGEEGWELCFLSRGSCFPMLSHPGLLLPASSKVHGHGQSSPCALKGPTESKALLFPPLLDGAGEPMRIFLQGKRSVA